MKEVFNASIDVVVAKWDGASYVFRPGERKEIMNDYAARDIVNRWGKHGLVDITFTKKISEQYIDQEIYIHEQNKKALKRVLEGLLESSQLFQAYDQECGDKPTVERLRYGNKHKDLQAKIKKFESALSDLEAVDTKSLLERKAAKLREQAEALNAQAAALNGNNVSKSKNERAHRIA